MTGTPLAPGEAKTDVLRRFADQGTGHINCAQAVLRFSLLVSGADTAAMALARQFGGGIAGTGETCGAVTGAALSLGLLDDLAGAGTDPAASRAALQELTNSFAVRFGALRCRGLTGFDLTTVEGHEAFVSSGGNERCQDFVGWMCDQLAPLLESKYRHAMITAEVPPTTTTTHAVRSDEEPGQ